VALNLAPLVELVTKYFDELDDEYGDDAELVDAVIMVDVRHRDQDGGTASTVEGRSLSGRNTQAVGITVRGLNTLLRGDED
jgi:hypothetical protein